MKEFEDLDAALNYSFSLLNESMRRKFLLTQFPPWVLLLAVACLGGLLLSLDAYASGGTPSPLSRLLHFPLDSKVTVEPYALWLTSMGALGSIAFISMNLLAVQNDITFDMTSSRMILVRIIIGCTFGLVLSFPFGYKEFISFADTIALHKLGDAKDTSTTTAFQQALFLLLPFVLGFSTSLVILFINRLIQGIQTIFGWQHVSTERVPPKRKSVDVGAAVSRPSQLTNFRRDPARRGGRSRRN
ncbi:hypothetical protein [Trinickia mobilis]|uniref:hypothetical protein n=1 Tax=Trinickia mobilis TaxID=2816356 RepID=UPI001A900196|nr:hypothetical protein [Trinickia mobilis]